MLKCFANTFYVLPKFKTYYTQLIVYHYMFVPAKLLDVYTCKCKKKRRNERPSAFLIPDVMRHWKSRSSVKQNLEYLIVVPVCCQDQRGDLGGEGSSVAVNPLPGLQ